MRVAGFSVATFCPTFCRPGLLLWTAGDSRRVLPTGSQIECGPGGSLAQAQWCPNDRGPVDGLGQWVPVGGELCR